MLLGTCRVACLISTDYHWQHWELLNDNSYTRVLSGHSEPKGTFWILQLRQARNPPPPTTKLSTGSQDYKELNKTVTGE